MSDEREIRSGERNEPKTPSCLVKLKSEEKMLVVDIND